MIRLDASGWELHPGPECEGCTPHHGLRERAPARIFLQRFKRDPFAVETMRHIMARDVLPGPLNRITTDEVTNHFAALLGRGLWHVHAPALREDDAGGKPGSEPEEEEDLAEIVQGAAPQASDQSPRPQPVQEEGALPRNADEAAIVAAMKLASKLGIPFCEECAKAAMKRAREAAHA